jgi:hypothetical protein
MGHLEKVVPFFGGKYPHKNSYRVLCPIWCAYRLANIRWYTLVKFVYPHELVGRAEWKKFVQPRVHEKIFHVLAYTRKYILTDWLALTIQFHCTQLNHLTLKLSQSFPQSYFTIFPHSIFDNPITHNPIIPNLLFYNPIVHNIIDTKKD